MRTEHRTAKAPNKAGKLTKRNVRLHYFDSVADHMAFDDSKEKPWMAPIYARPSGSGHSWWGCDTADLHRFIAEGWPEGVELLSDLEFPEVEAMHSIRRRARRGDHGSEVDAAAIACGNLEWAWTRHERTARLNVSRATIAVHVGCHCMEDASAVKWSGAAALKVADAMEQAGYRVRIVAFDASLQVNKAGTPQDVAWVTTAKEHDQPINLAALAATLVLTGFNRWHGFKLYSADRADNQKGTLGKSPSNPLERPSFRGMIATPSDEALLIAPRIRSRQDASEWISAALAQATAPNANA